MPSRKASTSTQGAMSTRTGVDEESTFSIVDRFINKSEQHILVDSVIELDQKIQRSTQQHPQTFSQETFGDFTPGQSLTP